MSDRAANEVARDLESRLQRTLSCVTASVLVPREDELGKPHRLLLHPPARLHAPTVRLEMRVTHAYNVIPDADVALGHRTSTASYFYDIAELLEHGQKRDVLSYHWNPSAVKGDPPFPHVHIYVERRIGGNHLSKMHLPTGRVSFESFIRLLILEFQVFPLKDDWADIVRDTERTFHSE